jgi:hypothetical protein
MTYEELAGMLDCDVAAACHLVVEEQLDRKISRDGRKRVKLSLELFGIFIDRVRASEHPLDRAVDDLKQAHCIMSNSSIKQKKPTDEKRKAVF